MENLRFDELVEYIRNKFGNIRVIVREDFISFSKNVKIVPRIDGDVQPQIAEKLALSRVRQINTKNQNVPPLPMEIEYEKKNLFYKSFGVLYDGFKISILFSEMIPEDEFDLEHCHIIFTNQLFGTWDDNDKRYHARVSVYGFPSIISTTGIVEAPAKPREFYLRQKFGIDTITLERELKGKFIDYDDPRITEVLKGYVMQAIFFHITGSPFCEDKDCRLYNAHWQEEVIHAQLGSYEFCNKHQQILNEVKKGW